MDEEKAAKFVAMFRKMAAKLMDVERRVLDLEDEEREEDRWFAELLRELEGIDPLTPQSPTVTEPAASVQ